MIKILVNYEIFLWFYKVYGQLCSENIYIDKNKNIKLKNVNISNLKLNES